MNTKSKNKKPNKDKYKLLSIFTYCIIILSLNIFNSCNSDLSTPLPIPIDVKISTQGYANIDGRIGAGDFTKEFIFQLNNLPEDGYWQYSLIINDEPQQGYIYAANSTAQIPNKKRSEWWIDLNNLSNDSIDIELVLFSDSLGYEHKTFLYQFKMEMHDIKSWQDLQAMGYDLAGEFTLHNDITFPDPAQDNFPENGFVPIGVSPGTGNAFTGTLNGNGYSINNLTIQRQYMNYVGLFGALSNSAEIKNLNIKLSDVGIIGYDYVGALAGYAEKSCKITDCEMFGKVYGNNYVGGLVGCIEGNSLISFSRATAEIKGNNNIGGISGFTNYASITKRCFSEINIIGINNVGGLIGWNNGLVEECQVDIAEVKGKKMVGGLTGQNNGFIKKCAVPYGSIDGDSATGGIAGYCGSKSLIYTACSKVDVTGKLITGGAMGLNCGKVNNCYSAHNKVSGNIIIGGFAGESHNEIKNSYSNTLVISESSPDGHVGGFIGNNVDATLTNNYWTEDNNPIKISIGNGDITGIYMKKSEDFITFEPDSGDVREIFTGWDFEVVWAILDTKNKGFPYLNCERDLTIEF
jgi:hypothetical protein